MKSVTRYFSIRYNFQESFQSQFYSVKLPLDEDNLLSSKLPAELARTRLTPSLSTKHIACSIFQIKKTKKDFTYYNTDSNECKQNANRQYNQAR